jgi:TrmH family RNA methyltransferase
MIGKSKIKFLTSLKETKYRKVHRRFIAEGNTLVIDFLNSGSAVEGVFALKSWIDKYGDKFPGINIEEISDREMRKISNLKNHSEVLAVVAMSKKREEISLVPDKWSLMLDGIRDPGNMGTIIRAAEWFGVENIYCSTDTVDAYNPKVVQATMGSLARIKIHYASLAKLLSEKPRTLTAYGTFLTGDDIRNVEKGNCGVIVIGSEAHGISNELVPLIDKKITVKPAPSSKAESLNASVAAALACFALI